MTVVGREIGPALAIFRPKANFEGTPLGADGATDPVERNAIHNVTLDAVAAKDAGLIVETGRALGVPTPAGAAVLQVLVGAIAAGLGDHDWADLVAAAERQGDVELKWAVDQ